MADIKDSEQLIYQLALTMTPKIGPVTARKLVEETGSAEAVFRAGAKVLKAIPGVGEQLIRLLGRNGTLKEAAAEAKNMKRHGIGAISIQDPGYPGHLKDCIDAPLLLFYKGELRSEKQPDKVLSIVGTRNATQYGREVTELIVAGLAERHPGLVIVSGLAYGIDIMAHRFALKYGLHTYAVLAHGLTTLYPSSHRDVARKILGQGALLTDFHTGVRPERNNFLRRNRIIAGISRATLVVESGIRGGALITAEMALGYNRDVLAVPGRVTDAASAGCNLMVKDLKAAMVENAADIEKVLSWLPAGSHSQLTLLPEESLTREEDQVLKVLTREPGIGLEILKVRTALPPGKLMGILLQLELRNLVTAGPGNTYRTRVKIQ